MVLLECVLRYRMLITIQKEDLIVVEIIDLLRLVNLLDHYRIESRLSVI